VNAVIQALKDVTRQQEDPVPLHAPVFSGNEWQYVKECLDTGWVSSVGCFVDQFERMLVEYTGAGYAIAVVNGTAALHVALILAGVKPGDEVIIPDMTFVATANAVAYCGAVPHLADIDPATLGLDPDKLDRYLHEIVLVKEGVCINKSTGRPIRAVVPMHTFGHPVDLDKLVAVAEKYRLAVVEDAAESLGSFYKGKHTGTFGMLAAISFNGNKIVTTGGGGAILTNDPELAKLAKHLTTTAKLPHSWEYVHDRTGFNYRLPNLNAAVGCAQLEQLPGFLERKRRLADKYRAAFAGVSGVTFFTEPEGARSNYWLNVLLLDEAFASRRDELLETANAAGVMTRPAWTLMHRLEMYKQCPRMDLSNAEDIAGRLINIPSSANLVDE
jgi:perosamine synthetase